MSATVKKINSFFKSAKRADVDKVLSEIILSERQKKVLSTSGISNLDAYATVIRSKVNWY